MLVLTRRKDEAIFINDIKVTVVDLKNGSVKLGIDAPKDVVVHRQEVYEAIQKQKKETSNLAKASKDGR